MKNVHLVKTPSRSANRLWRLFFSVFTGVIFAAPAARAGLTVDIHLYRDNIGYYFYPWLNADTNTPGFPDGYYMIASPQIPNNGSQLQYQATNNTLNYATGGGNYYFDFDSVLYAITNGQWSIRVTNATSTNQYQFTVTVTGVTSNSFDAPALAVLPANGAQFVTNQPLFQWTGPANWAGILNVNDDFIDTNGNHNYETSARLPPDQTSWQCPVALPDGTNDFNADYTSNVTAQIVASVPLDNAARPISAWTSTATLETSFDSIFAVGAPGIGGHTLVACYTFDNSSYLGQDSSGNGNDLNGGSSWGSPQQTFSTNAEAGGGAVRFFGVSSMTLNGQSLASLDAVLAGSFTFSAWVNTTNSIGNDTDDAVSGASIFWAYNDHSNTNDTIPLAITGSKAAFSTRDHLGNTTTIHSLTSVNDGNYHLITVTRDQASGAMNLYVDGNLEASATGATDPLNGNNYYLSVGGNSISSYIGLLDDLQIYSGVLASGDVATLYNNPGATVPNIAGTTEDFNTALGTTGLNWTTSGDTTWFVETNNTGNGATSAAQSGSVINSQSSTLSATLIGPGTITFDWSSIANDPNGGFYCEFDMDGSYEDSISGDTGWYQDGPFTIGPGAHTLSWTAYADNDTDPTQAGYLDQVSFTPGSAPVITVNPFSQTNYPGYNAALYAVATSNPTATWQWYEVGSGAISGATSPLFIPTNSGAAGVAGSYYAVASNSSGSANTTTAAVAFVSAPLPPDWSRAFRSPFYSADNNPISDYNGGCAVDPAGDVYVANQYVGDVNVEDSHFAFAANLTAVGTNGGAALIKYADTNLTSNASPLVWAVGLTNNDPASYSYAVCVAVAPGNGAYLAANLFGTNWLGANQYANNGSGSILLSRFDANGSNVWSQFITGTSGVFGPYNTLISDASGNVTVAGLMNGAVSFGGTNLTAVGEMGFLAQYNANGGLRWAQMFPNTPWDLAGNGGQIYLAVMASTAGGVTNVSLGGLSNLTDRAWAVACLNATNGQALWLRGVGEKYGAHGSGVINDMPLISASGTNVFLTGNAYGSSASFGGLSIGLPNGIGQYFARYDTNGNPQTATAFGSPTTVIWATAANSSGVYVSGDFDQYSAFGNLLIAAPEYVPNYLGSGYFTQPFVAKFDLNGNPLWARHGVSPVVANFRGLATTANGVWASGFLDVTNELYNGVIPAQFGTNLVVSDSVLVGSPIGTVVFSVGGLVAKITDGASNPMAVTLTNAASNGAGFQFQFLSESGFTHNVLYRTNLLAGEWKTNSTVAGDGTLKTVSIPMSLFAPSSQGFVRVTTQ